jgi:hypothetical protein
VDLDDLVGDEPVGLAVDRLGGLLRGSLDQALDFPCRAAERLPVK